MLLFWNSRLSFVIAPIMQDDSQCDCRNACNLIKAANRWDLLKIHFLQYRIPRKSEMEIENDDIIGGIAGRCPTCWTCPTRPWCTSRARCERRTWRRWLSSIEHQKIMTAMTTAMALGPGSRGSDAAFRHETTEEGPKEAGIIIIINILIVIFIIIIIIILIIVLADARCKLNFFFWICPGFFTMCCPQ